jgi:hypothetical protein
MDLHQSQLALPMPLPAQGTQGSMTASASQQISNWTTGMKHEPYHLGVSCQLFNVISLRDI